MIRRVEWSAAFVRLGRDAQLNIVQGWDRQRPVDVDVAPADEPEPKWYKPDPTETMIELPNGTKMVSSADSNPDYIPTDYVLPRFGFGVEPNQL